MKQQPKAETNPLARREGLVIRELADEVLVYDLDRDRAHCLNQTAAFIWQCCDGRTSTETVRREAPLETVSEHTLSTSAIIGLPSETHRESVLIDRVGRLQLPKEALESFPFNGRAEVRIVNDHVELWPIASNGSPLAGTEQAGDQTTRGEVK